jgi:DNA invertase Pin-like site-specific DNA recombinase
MITILGGLAEFERSLIAARTAEGRKRAIANGVRLGRNTQLTEIQIKDIRKRRAAGETFGMIADIYKVGRATAFRAANEGYQPQRQKVGRK